MTGGRHRPAALERSGARLATRRYLFGDPVLDLDAPHGREHAGG